MQKLLGMRDKLTKYLIAAILLAIPLYPKFPFMRLPKTHVAIRLEDFLLLFASLFLALLIIKDLRKFLQDKIIRAIGLFLLIGLTSLLSAFFITKTVFEPIAFLHWIRRIEYFVPFLLGLVALRTINEDIGFYVKTILVSIFAVFAYGVGQKHLSFPVIATQNEEVAKGIAQLWTKGSHLYSTFAGHYDLASFFVLILPIVVSLLLILKGKKTKAVLFAAFIAGLWLLANSLSRISVVSYLLSVTISLILIKRYKAIPVILAISILVFGLSSSLLDRYSNIIQVTRENIEKMMYVAPGEVYAVEENPGVRRKRDALERPTPIPVFEDRSTSIRLDKEWPRAIRAFTKNPLLGTGYSSITLATDNDYLRLLGEVGILGFLAFSLIFLRLFEVLFKTFPPDKYFKGIELGFMAGYLGALPGVFANAFFLDVFEASKFAIIFWLLTGLAISLVRKKKNEKFI